MSVFVIGEMASSHDGELDNAKRLVDVAVAAGCDAVKVQFWSDADRLADRRGVPQHYRDIYRKYQMSFKWLRILKDYCGERIEFMATCFLPEDVNTISPFVNRFKISAFESGDRELLHAVCNIAKKRILLMSVNTLRDREGDVVVPEGGNFANFDNQYLDHIVKTNALRERAQHGIDDVLMYCVTEYPAPLSRVDLSQLQEAASNGIAVGFSDHTGDIDMGAYAVCAGATYIEAHCQLLTTDHANPDAGTFAHSPASLKQYVQNIRKAEVVMSQAGRPLLAETRLTRYRVIR